MVDDCLFCKLSEDKGKIIYENDAFYSILDLNQDVPGHALVISKKHFENILGLPNSLCSEALDCIKKTAVKVMEDNNAEGFNIVVNTGKAAGMMINHVHFHIFPRKHGDNVVMIE